MLNVKLYAIALFADRARTVTIRLVAGKVKTFNPITEKLKIFINETQMKFAHFRLGNAIAVRLVVLLAQMLIFLAVQHIFAMTESLQQRNRLQSKRIGLSENRAEFILGKCFRMNRRRNRVELHLVFDFPKNRVVTIVCRLTEKIANGSAVHLDDVEIHVKNQELTISGLLAHNSAASSNK